MTDPNATQEMEIVSGDKKLRMRGSDLLTSVIGMIVVGGLVVIFMKVEANTSQLSEHRNDASRLGEAVVGAMKEVASVTKESAYATRVQNCLLEGRFNNVKVSLETCERQAR